MTLGYYPYTTVERVGYRVVDARLDRADLRKALRCRWSMDDADRWLRLGLFRPRAYDRFLRLWAWSTATEHPLTRGVPLARWWGRRKRIRHAVRRVLDA